MKKAIIFDMDGVIFDTEKILLKCWKKSGIKFNINLKDEEISLFRGTTAIEGEKIFKKLYPNIDFFEIRKERERLKDEYILKNGLPLKEGIEDFIKYIKDKNIKIALATSTKQSIAMKYLIDSNLAKYFDYIICGDMVKESKPSPCIYIEACKNLDISPKDVIVFEDSKNGILSAHNAGCDVIMVVDIDEDYEETKNIIIGKVHNYQEAKKFID